MRKASSNQNQRWRTTELVAKMVTSLASYPEPHFRQPRANRAERARVIVLVIGDLEFGGAQRQVIELANHMDPLRYEVHVCSLSDYVPLGDKLTDRERRLHVIPRRSKWDLSVVPRLAWLLWKLNADVVHSFLFDAAIASRLAGRIAKTPAVIGSERNTDYAIRKRHLFAYRLTRWCHDLTIANSNAGANFNSRMLLQSRESYRVIHNGVDVERFRPGDGAAARAELGLGPKHRVVGMFASFKEQKNHPLLLRAARRLLDKFQNLCVLFVGDELFAGGRNSTAWKREVQQVVDDLGLRPYCLFAGNRADVERFYPACDLTVLPSLFEGTPNAALESMACGVPVIVTNVSDNTYVIPDGKVGYVIPSSDEKALAERICLLLRDDAMRSGMGRRARMWVLQEFSCQRLAERTAAVYEEALRLKRH